MHFMILLDMVINGTIRYGENYFSDTLYLITLVKEPRIFSCSISIANVDRLFYRYRNFENMTQYFHFVLF